MGLSFRFRQWTNLFLFQFRCRDILNNRSETKDNVLLIKLDAIGDFIIWLDSAKEYRKLYPNKKIVLLCNHSCKEIAEITGYFDEIIVLDIKKFENDSQYRFEQIDFLTKNGYEILIQTAFSRTQHMDLLAAVIPARLKIGYEADESRSNLSRHILFRKNKKKLDRIYDKIIPSTNEDIMELLRNRDFIRGLGNNNFECSIPSLPQIQDVKIPDYEYFVVFSGASTPIKMWKSENFAQVINHIQKQEELKCIICGSSNEEYLYEKIREKVDKKELLENFCGKTNMTDLIEIVRSSRFVISNDTSGIHFAAATGTMGVCPFGEYNFGRFLPYKSDSGINTIQICSANMKCRNCSKHHMSFTCIINILKTGRYLCLDKVRVDSVAKVTDNFLGTN